MPRRAAKKRVQRRQRQIENEINENGLDHVGGQYRVFRRKGRQYITPPLSWEDAVKVWQDCDDCIILDAQYTRKT